MATNAKYKVLNEQGMYEQYDLETSITQVRGLQDELDTLSDGKVDAAQGVDNAGKYLAVGTDGNVTLVKGGSTPSHVIYGFRIDPDESDPAAAVTYLEDAVGMTPACMNYQNDIFDYGSWENAFFMPRPCMLKYDGTVDYYLDPGNYKYKEDGVTASDVTNSSYGGNAMMEWGQNGKKIWCKIVPSSVGGKGSVYIADYQADEDYKCYSFIGKNNNVNDHFYTPIYNGSNVSSKLRSLSGMTHMVSQTGTTEISYAQANGSGWNIECLADRLLITCLLILMGKSLDTQKTFGNGHYSGGSDASSNLKTGLLDSKGLFWGSSGNVGVKVFGMENFWGEVWRRTNGYINASGALKIKLTEGTYDGSTIGSYGTSGDGYITIGSCPSASASYISKMLFNQYGFFPSVVSGSSSTYFCDGMWSNNSQTDFALFGGCSNYGAFVGAFAVNLANTVSAAYWNTGAAPSYKKPS